MNCSKPFIHEAHILVQYRLGVWLVFNNRPYVVVGVECFNFNTDVVIDSIILTVPIEFWLSGRRRSWQFFVRNKSSSKLRRPMVSWSRLWWCLVGHRNWCRLWLLLVNHGSWVRLWHRLVSLVTWSRLCPDSVSPYSSRCRLIIS